MPLMALDIPHSSTVIPEDVGAELLLSALEVEHGCRRRASARNPRCTHSW